ncbi:MAG: glycosyltransferase family 39 protein [Candidatus Glassbacteria bacterium]
MLKLISLPQKHPCLSVFLLALAVRILSLSLDTAYLTLPFDQDAGSYYTLAMSLASGRGMLLEGQPSAACSPLYPMFLAAVSYIPGNFRLNAVLIQAVIGALLVVLVFLAAGLLFSSRRGWIAALAAAFYPGFVLTGNWLRTETLFLPLLVAGVYWFETSRRGPGPAQAMLSAAALALSALTRSTSFFLPLLFTVVYLFDLKNAGVRKGLFKIAVFLLTYAAVYSPWVLRNYLTFGEPVLTTSNTGMVLYTGNFPLEGKLFGFNPQGAELSDDLKRAMDLPELERDKFLHEYTRKKILEDPWRAISLLRLKTLYFWSPFDWEVLGHSEGTLNAGYLWILLFAALALFSGGWRGNLVPVLVVAYFFLLCLPTYGSPRLRLPIEPFLIALAASGWEWAEGRTSAGGRFILLASVILSSVCGYAFGYQIKEFAAGILVRLGLW